MKLQWIITNEDIELIHNFINCHKDKSFVRNRINKNLLTSPVSISVDVLREKIWKQIVACLLTTQQRSGPNSKISKFLNISPFLLNYKFCKESIDINKDVFNVITEFGGIRRTNTISEEIEYNLNWLEKEDGWEKLIKTFNLLLEEKENKSSLEKIQIERNACLVAQNLKGIGPKQSRNLWQSLGVTVFEIPIDSRIIKWLNNNNFPFKISPNSLSDESYYQLVMTGIQKLCLEAHISPCILDAVIFSSYDEEWPENNNPW